MVALSFLDVSVKCFNLSVNENTACIVSDLLLHIHVRVFISDDSVASGGFDVAHLQESLTTFIQKFASKGQYIFIFIFIF